MKGKKSSIVLKAMAVSILSIFVVVTFLQAGKAYGSQDIFFKSALARDLAIMIDALYALPGDVYIEYPIDLDPADFRGYGIKITPNKVTIFSSEVGEFDASSASYHFTGMEGLDPSITLLDPNKLIIRKEGNLIIFSGEDDNT